VVSPFVVHSFNPIMHHNDECMTDIDSDTTHNALWGLWWMNSCILPEDCAHKLNHPSIFPNTILNNFEHVKCVSVYLKTVLVWSPQGFFFLSVFRVLIMVSLRSVSNGFILITMIKCLQIDRALWFSSMFATPAWHLGAKWHL